MRHRDPELAKVVLFTEKSETSSLYLLVLTPLLLIDHLRHYFWCCYRCCCCHCFGALHDSKSYKGLSATFKGRLNLLEVRSSEKPLSICSFDYSSFLFFFFLLFLFTLLPAYSISREVQRGEFPYAPRSEERRIACRICCTSFLVLLLVLSFYFFFFFFDLTMGHTRGS